MADATAPPPETAPAATPFRPSPRTGAALLAALLLAGALHLARPNRSAHLYAAPFAGPVAYAFNADSPSFARVVARFPKGFVDCEQGQIRLNRPLYSFLGWLVSLPLRPLQGLVPEAWERRATGLMSVANHPEIWTGITGREIVTAWVALVMVNLLLALAGLLLFHGALRALFPPATALALSLLPAAHPNTIEFIFVPTTASFDLLIPAVFAFCAARAWAAGRRGHGGALGLGVCMLGKGFAAPFANWAWEHAARRGGRAGWRDLSVAASLFAGPALLYLAFVSLAGVPARNPDVERFRQGVWMLDWLREGRAVEIPLRWAEGLARHAGHVVRGFWVPVAAILLLALRQDRNPFRLPVPLAGHLGVYAAACAAFWALLGFQHVRLSAVQYPVAAFVLGAVATRKSIRPEAWIGATVAASAAAAVAFPIAH